jgi:hypothetical protein
MALVTESVQEAPKQMGIQTSTLDFGLNGKDAVKKGPTDAAAKLLKVFISFISLSSDLRIIT